MLRARATRPISPGNRSRWHAGSYLVSPRAGAPRTPRMPCPAGRQGTAWVAQSMLCRAYPSGASGAKLGRPPAGMSKCIWRLGKRSAEGLARWPCSPAWTKHATLTPVYARQVGCPRLPKDTPGAKHCAVRKRWHALQPLCAGMRGLDRRVSKGLPVGLHWVRAKLCSILALPSTTFGPAWRAKAQIPSGGSLGPGSAAHLPGLETPAKVGCPRASYCELKRSSPAGWACPGLLAMLA